VEAAVREPATGRTHAKTMPSERADVKKPVIVFEGVRIGFEHGDVLADVSFTVGPQETKVLLGETGSGKTLLLKIAAGLIRPDAGRLNVLGHCLDELSERELLAFRRQVGFVFQEGALFDSLSVRENVGFRLHEEGMGEEEIEDRVRQALRFVEMEDAIDKLPAELSGGMRRRVAIARAIIHRPPVVLYDSPTAGLDPVTAQTIIALILRLRDRSGVTALLATHRVQDAFALACFRYDPEENRVVRIDSKAEAPRTRVLVLRDGHVYFEDEAEALLRTQDAYLRRFLVSSEAVG
jgi:phospholipid/cholesterol/gamma-HCH transport system ATP-binding protein